MYKRQARQVAASTGRVLVDTDEWIETKSGMTIPQIFALEEETGFRKRETEVILEAATRTGQVISCGGGAILAPENRCALRQNGRDVYKRQFLYRFHSYPFLADKLSLITSCLQFTYIP